MIYEQLFASDQPIRAGLLGTGDYGLTLLGQVAHVERLDIPAICDINLDAAKDICRRAGVPDEQVVICADRAAVLKAIDAGQTAIVEDYALLMDTPLDVIVECTGNPEAGARHAEAAIQHGKHVAMVNKEADSVIGPMLHKMADAAGVVYTPVDGDQHGLLMGMVSWARGLGLEVVAGGKARPADFIYDLASRTLSDGATTWTLDRQQVEALAVIQGGDTRSAVAARRVAFNTLPQLGAPDVCESVIAANATGLLPDVPGLHAPLLRTIEIPRVMCPAGGLLNRVGAIDVVTCLRRADEVGFGGGVWLVFKCPNPHVWDFLRAKGVPSDRHDEYGLLLRPYHLLGVETPISILVVALLKVSTGSTDYRPRVDMVARAAVDLKAGDTITYHHGSDMLDAMIYPATAATGNNHIPYFMATGNRVKRGTPLGAMLTVDMIEAPAESRLWALRRQQDQTFLK